MPGQKYFNCNAPIALIIIAGGSGGGGSGHRAKLIKRDSKRDQMKDERMKRMKRGANKYSRILNRVSAVLTFA